MKKIILMAVIALGFSVSAQAYTSATYCAAVATCYNAYGYPTHTVSCQVYGGSYSPIGGGSACNWTSVQGQGVSCNGYVQTYGGWAWQNISYSCY